jgi:hypothetical protein
MTVLLVFAFVFFVIATFMGPTADGTPWYGRFNLVSAGLACWVGAELFRGGIFAR